MRVHKVVCLCLRVCLFVFDYACVRTRAIFPVPVVNQVLDFSGAVSQQINLRLTVSGCAYGRQRRRK